MARKLGGPCLTCIPKGFAPVLCQYQQLPRCGHLIDLGVLPSVAALLIRTSSCLAGVASDEEEVEEEGSEEEEEEFEAV